VVARPKIGREPTVLAREGKRRAGRCPNLELLRRCLRSHQAYAGDTELLRLVRTGSEVGVDEGWLLARARESQVRLQVSADLAGSKHTGDSRNRGKGEQPAWPITTPDRRGRGDAHLWRTGGVSGWRASHLLRNDTQLTVLLRPFP
jgi:hypothetical protein